MVKLKGVSVHHAEQAEAKLRAKGCIDDAKVLREHLKLVALSELLHANAIFGIDDSEYCAACTKLMKKVSEFPLVVQMNAVLRQLRNKGKCVMDVQSFIVVFEIAWTRPLGANITQTQAFDILHNPRNSALNVEMAIRVSIFAQKFWKGVVTNLLSQGADKVAMMTGVATMMLAETERVLDGVEDMDDSEATLTCEMLVSCRSILALACPGDFAVSLNVLEVLQDIIDLHQAADSTDKVIMQSTILAMRDAEPWASNMELILQKQATIKDLRLKVLEHFDLFEDTSESLDIELRCSATENVLGEATRVVHGFGDKLRAKYDAVIQEGVCSLASLVNDTPNATKRQLQACTKMLAEACNIFPMSMEVSEWISTLGSRLATTSNQAVINTFKAVAGGIKHEAECKAKVDDLASVLSNLDGIAFDNAAVEHAVTVLKLLHRACLANLQDSKLSSMLLVAGELQGRLPSEMQFQPADFMHFSKAAAVVSLVHKFRSDLSDESGNVIFEKLEATSSANHDVDDLLQKNAELLAIVPKAEAEDQRLQPLSAITSMGSQLLAAIASAKLEATRIKANTAAQKLQDIAGGVPGGAKWTAAIPKGDIGKWEKVKAVADATIAKEVGVARMRPEIEAVEEVLVEHFSVRVADVYMNVHLLLYTKDKGSI